MAAVKRAVLLGGLGAVILLFTMAFRVQKAAGPRRVYSTVGELQPVHARVTVAGEDVRGPRRFAAGEAIQTDAYGRGRAVLDDGTNLVIDVSTRLSVAEGRIGLDSGRLFVRGAPGSRAELSVGGAVVLVGTSTVAAERSTEGSSSRTQVYCVSGEVVARASGKEARVHAGETVQVDGDNLVVAPEKAFNDWTRGMAHAWSASGSANGKPRGAIGELWGRVSGELDGVTSPLAIRSHDVSATIVGEVATTETRTTYFNAGGAAVTGDFRMALPPDALVSGFATGAGDALTVGSVRLASETTGSDSVPVLEWAGEGWVRGRTGAIAAGQTATVVVRYVEWLSPAAGRLMYRYPMVSDGRPPVIGEFHATVDVAGVDPSAVGVTSGMTVSGDTVEVRHADFRPSSDLVVDLTLRPGSFDAARAYLVPGPDNDAAGSFVMVRSELAARASTAGVSLAMVVDTSQSIDATSLDAERGLVEAVLDGLGPEDSVVVFAADAMLRPVGPATLGPVDVGRRAAIRTALADLRTGGATDLGVALERAADALPSGSGAATLLYVGDGWATLGDTTPLSIRTRLSRRAGGLPRLGAVAVGPTANRFGLAALVRGAGPVLGIDDRDGAAEAAVSLLAEALRPSVTGVEADLGPDVERVYPRGGQTLRSGDTFTTVGRTKGRPPRLMTVRYRDGTERKTVTLPLSLTPALDPEDIARRWSAARVYELMLRGGGPEVVVDAAKGSGLLTPWTGWAVGLSPGDPFRATPLAARVLDAGLEGSLALFSSRFATPPPAKGALTAASDSPWPSATKGDDDAGKRAVEWSARRTLDDARGSVRQCRDSRASLRPDAGGNLQVSISLGTDGRVRDARVRGATSFDDDAALDRCVELVLRNLRFFSLGAGSAVTLSYEYHLPPSHDARAGRCSPTSTLPAAMRRGVWFERLRRPDSEQNPVGAHGERAYFRAKAACEAPSWAERRTFLELLLDVAPDGPARVELGRLLDEGGDVDAGTLVRKQAVRRAESPGELEAVRRALLANEPDVGMPFVRAYAKANDDVARLAVLETHLSLSPHDSRLRRKELLLLESLGRKEELLGLSAALRSDPFIDAGVLADTASALRRSGYADESARAFGELVERAPQIPFARAFLGDRLLDEGDYDGAVAAYDTLMLQLPDDPAASFRLALAHAGAGRLDIALRLLSRVSETGGRTSDSTLSPLASMVSHVLVADARGRGIAKDEDQRLGRRVLDVPIGDAQAFVLVRAPTWVPAMRASFLRGATGSEVESSALRAPSLGLVGFRVEHGEGAFRVRVGRQADIAPARGAVVRVSVLVLGAQPKLVTKDVALRADGEDAEVGWSGSALL